MCNSAFQSNQYELHKKAFDTIIEKYNLKTEEKSNEIAELLTNGTDGVNAQQFAEKFGMEVQEAVVFLEWIKVGINFKQTAIDTAKQSGFDDIAKKSGKKKGKKKRWCRDGGYAFARKSSEPWDDESDLCFRIWHARDIEKIQSPKMPYGNVDTDLPVNDKSSFIYKEYLFSNHTHTTMDPLHFVPLVWHINLIL